MSTDVLAFMSLARLSSGNGSRQDVFALVASLLGSIVPGASIAFYLGAPGANVLTAVEAVGPAAERVRGLRIREGDRLTGWVAANRRAIVNSDAALDLGERAGADAGGEWLKTLSQRSTRSRLHPRRRADNVCRRGSLHG